MPASKLKRPKLDVTELLHEDHQKVRELFFEFSAAEDESEKNLLVKNILTELFIHSTVEERIVYPAVKEEAEEGDELTGEALNEHRVVKFLMAELSKMKASDEQFDAKVKVLCELVDHHVREEEKEMFEKLRQSGADLAELAEQVEEMKEQLESKPLPDMKATLEIAGQTQEPGKQSKGSKTSKFKSAKNGRKSA